MSFTATPLDQNRRVDRNTFFNKQAQNQQARLVPASYSFGAPSVETRSPPKVIPHTLEDPDEPALVRFAKRKQQSATQNLDPQRWNVKDTSVQIANALQQAITNENPMPPPVPVNPNDAWVTGATRRTNLPRSTSVEYEKETQSTATRRLNPPPSNRLPPRRPVSKTGSTNLVPESEDEAPPTYTRGKSPFEHVADTVRSLVNNPVNIHMKPRSPEREQSMASYDYASEERDYRNQPATPQQHQKRAPASKRNRISSDNKAYKPTVSDLEQSDDDFIDDDRKKRRRKKRNDSVGGPLTTLPVAGYDKKRRRKKNAKGEYVEEDDGSDTDEQSKVSEHRAASDARNSVPPPPRFSHPPEPPSYSEQSLEMAEDGLASIPEIEEPLETEVESDVPRPATSASSFSIGGLLGKAVNLALRSLMSIVSSVLSVLGYISWASTQALGTVLDGPKNLWKNRSGTLVSLVVLALAVYVLRNGGITPSWSTPSKHADYTPPETPAADISELAARLQTIERALYESNADSRHSQRRINDLTKSVSDSFEKISGLDRRLAADVSRINEAGSQNHQMTNKDISIIKKTVEDLQRKIQDGSLPGQKGGKSDVTSKELEKLLTKQREDLNAQWSIYEERIGAIEGEFKEVKEALEPSKSVGKPSASNAPGWWNKVTGKPPSAVTIKSTDGQDVTALIHDVVDSIISNWSKDNLARPDFALHPVGAQVIPALTSATYSISPGTTFGKAVGFVTGIGYATGLSPVHALHPQNHAGHCWPFQGSEGQLGVKLARRAYISDITIDHVAKELGFDLRSTPRQMEVWGLVEGQDNLAKATRWLADRQRRRSDALESGLPMDPEDEDWELPKSLTKDGEYIRIAKFLYDAHSTKNIQTFPVDPEVRALGVDFGVVVLVVKNNWGMPEFTCLYRFRVHGEMFGEIPQLYEPPSEEQTGEQTL